jgi:flagellar biosynthesis/type III secretory pathway chaperone
LIAVAPPVDDLATCLEDEASLYAQLAELGARERGAVVARDPAALNEIVAEKERLIAAVARAEASRQSWIAAWAAAGRVDPAGVTLNSLLRRLPAGEAAAIAPLRDRLLARVRDVAQVNHDNGQLVQGALRIVTGSLDAYARVGGQGSYQPTGQRARGSGTAVLDFRA